jgi:cytochrome c biogenesis protein CcmG/thiol:disulfide interchange protein DsbE
VNRTALVVGVVVAVPLVVFLALGFRTDPHSIESPLIGKPAPALRLDDLEGRTVDLAELAGRPVLINFWATWCQPCIAEHGVLLDAARRYGDRVRLLGVVYQDDPELIREFLARRGAWGPSLLDPGSEVALRYGVYGAPETFFVDGQGIVRRKVTGPLVAGAIDAYLAEVW